MSGRLGVPSHHCWTTAGSCGKDDDDATMARKGRRRCNDANVLRRAFSALSCCFVKKHLASTSCKNMQQSARSVFSSSYLPHFPHHAPRTTHHAPLTTTAVSHSHTTQAPAYYTNLRLAHAQNDSSMRCVLMVLWRALACSRARVLAWGS